MHFSSDDRSNGISCALRTPGTTANPRSSISLILAGSAFISVAPRLLNEDELDILEEMIAQRRNGTQVRFDLRSLFERFPVHHVALAEKPLVADAALRKSQRAGFATGCHRIDSAEDRLSIFR